MDGGAILHLGGGGGCGCVAEVDTTTCLINKVKKSQLSKMLGLEGGDAAHLAPLFCHQCAIDNVVLLTYNIFKRAV